MIVPSAKKWQEKIKILESSPISIMNEEQTTVYLLSVHNQGLIFLNMEESL